jgi:hypothetical protein
MGLVETKRPACLLVAQSCGFAARCAEKLCFSDTSYLIVLQLRRRVKNGGGAASEKEAAQRKGTAFPHIDGHSPFKNSISLASA